jgi:hypothetical protein
VVAGLTAAVALSLIAGIVVSSLFAVNASRSERRAIAGRLQAEKEKKKAEEARQKEEKEHLRSEWLLYAANIAAAQREWETNNVAVVWHYLDACRPDLRGWEHNYLYTLFNKNQTTLRGHTNWVYSVAFSADGKRIVSGSEDNTLKVWDAATGQETLTLKGHTGWVYSVAFSPDGKRIVSGSWDNTLKVWDARLGQEMPDAQVSP